jgi:hypothetical protein
MAARINRHFLPLSLGIAGIALVVGAFGTGTGDTTPAEDADDGVVLGELDLAEQAEIWRNQYRRMTPGGDEPLVQDVGELPAAWEEFSSTWDAAPAVRDLATWLVPFSAERVGSVTVLRDSNGTVLWSGTTDFAKPDSADVTLTGALVDELDWPLYDAARDEIESRLEAAYPMRGGPYTNGLRFMNAWVATNGDYHFDFAWESNGEVQVFCRAMHTTSWVETVVFTNDENEVETNDFTHWRNVDGERFRGSPDTWDLSGVLTVTNGVGSFTGTNILEDYDKVRFYTAAQLADSDGDGLTDGEEWLVSHSDPDLPDTDGDGIDDGMEYASGTSASAANVWWVVTTTNEWEEYGVHFVGDEPSWPPYPVWTNFLIVTGIPPLSLSNAVPIGVKLSGLVDDAITVDTQQVEWTNGAKVLSNLDVTDCITNLASKRFRVDLYDWPDLPDGGPNEVRLGRSDYPFRAVWEWAVPIDIRMEPIYSDLNLPLENPSGIILGSNALFSIMPTPFVSFPIDKIVWTSAFHKVEFTENYDNCTVEVCATNAGDDEILVSVEDIIGDFNLPPFHVKVMPLTVVTAKVGVVLGPNGQWAVDGYSITQAVEKANAILAQAGLQLDLDPSLMPIPYDKGYWDVICSSNKYGQLLSKIPNFGGLKVYFVNSLSRNGEGTADGVNNPWGMVVACGTDTNGNPRDIGHTLAHETSHACGLRDLFPYIISQGLYADGVIREEWMPVDWGNYGLINNEAIPIAYLMQRLLMYWRGSNCDIPSGEVYGVWYTHDTSTNRLWHLTNAPVGLSGMTNIPPVHQRP